MKLYIHMRCTTCKKAVKFLHDNKIEVQIINIELSPPTEYEIEKMIQYYNGDVKKVFNTSGIQYREMDIKNKIEKMEYREIIKLLSSNPMLVKRPFLLTENKGITGFDEKKWEELLK